MYCGTSLSLFFYNTDQLTHCKSQQELVPWALLLTQDELFFIYLVKNNILAGLLKETAKPEAKETFSNVSQLPQGVDSGALSPSHGFQRDLVRVIGNMCYRHAANQNKASYLLCLWIILKLQL